MEKSIYYTIRDSIKEGNLPEVFRLDDSASTASVPSAVPHDVAKNPSWAPGALDRLSLILAEQNDMDASDLKELEKAIKKCTAKVGNGKAVETICAWCRTHRVIEHISAIQGYVLEHQQELDTDRLKLRAIYLMCFSEEIECVKIGLVLIALFNGLEDKTKEIIRQLGLYDEFTPFAVLNMQNWENGNEEIFQLAKAIHGWGRVYAVTHLEPETDDIRHWLLMNGTKNMAADMEDVAALSIACWKKSGAEELLFEDACSPEAYQAIRSLLSALAWMDHISTACTDPERVLLRFLSQSQSFDLTLEDYAAICQIRDWAQSDGDDHPSVVSACEALLHSESCRNRMEEGVRSGQQLALELAESLSGEAGLSEE